MSISKPYHRFYRMTLPSDENRGYNSTAYLRDHSYAEAPEMYIRSFNLLQKELIQLFEYIEPDDRNLSTYSMKIYQLYVRVCLEVEANFTAILKENKYSRNPVNWTMDRDYYKINKTHHLSSYKVTYPEWRGIQNEVQPFVDWSGDTYKRLDWYHIYNKCKHNRYEYLHEANFGNLLKAFAGLFALLSSQFWNETYQPGDSYLSMGSSYNYYKGDFGIGDYLIISYPDDWKEDELYDFKWDDELSKETVRFQEFDFDSI